MKTSWHKNASHIWPSRFPSQRNNNTDICIWFFERISCWIKIRVAADFRGSCDVTVLVNHTQLLTESRSENHSKIGIDVRRSVDKLASNLFWWANFILEKQKCNTKGTGKTTNHANRLRTYWKQKNIMNLVARSKLLTYALRCIALKLLTRSGPQFDWTGHTGDLRMIYQQIQMFFLASIVASYGYHTNQLRHNWNPACQAWCVVSNKRVDNNAET